MNLVLASLFLPLSHFGIASSRMRELLVRRLTEKRYPLLSTGDVASVLMFGSVGSLGLFGAPLLDAKKARRHRTQWPAFAAATSSLPFLAIVQRRQRLVIAEIGWWRMALAVVLFSAAL